MPHRHGGHRPRSEMDRLFEDFFGGWPDSLWETGVTGRRGFPALNVWEDGENVYAEAEMPALELEDLELLVLGNELTIKGKRQGNEKEGVTYHCRERGRGPFNRTIRLPVEVDSNRVQATLKDGVLNVTLPKAETAKPRRIEVKSLSK